MITCETPPTAPVIRVGMCMAGAACQALRDVHFKFDFALLLLCSSVVVVDVVVSVPLRFSQFDSGFVSAFVVGAAINDRKRLFTPSQNRCLCVCVCV